MNKIFFTHDSSEDNVLQFEFRTITTVVVQTKIIIRAFQKSSYTSVLNTTGASHGR